MSLSVKATTPFYPLYDSQVLSTMDGEETRIDKAYRSGERSIVDCAEFDRTVTRGLTKGSPLYTKVKKFFSSKMTPVHLSEESGVSKATQLTDKLIEAQSRASKGLSGKAIQSLVNRTCAAMLITNSLAVVNNVHAYMNIAAEGDYFIVGRQDGENSREVKVSYRLRERVTVVTSRESGIEFFDGESPFGDIRIKTKTFIPWDSSKPTIVKYSAVVNLSDAPAHIDAKQIKKTYAAAFKALSSIENPMKSDCGDVIESIRERVEA